MRAWDCLGRQGKAAGFRMAGGFVVWLTEAAPERTSGQGAADRGQYCEATRATKPPSDVGVLVGIISLLVARRK